MFRMPDNPMSGLWHYLRVLRALLYALLPERLRLLLRCEAGMSTAEYAVGTLTAVALATVLYFIVTSDAVAAELGALVKRALSVDF